MANEITSPGTTRTLRIPASKSVSDKQKNIPIPVKKPKPDKKKKPDDDAPVHIDEYI
ncbi:MAG: hypothetical protein P1U52_05495 [Porticoccaceae bacterium]|nr:hypothetical protein [Porticoccaceae bacterium]